MSEISDEILKRGAADSDITAFRDECFSAWTTYRDAMEDAGECADITDYRTGFFVGVCAGLNAHATLTEQLAEAKAKVERFEAMLEAAYGVDFKDPEIYRFMSDIGDIRWAVVFDDSERDYPDALSAFEAIQEGRDAKTTD